jgi:hypothetical protein
MPDPQITTTQYPPPYRLEFDNGNRAAGRYDTYRVMDSANTCVVAFPTYQDPRRQEFLELAVDSLNAAARALEEEVSKTPTPNRLATLVTHPNNSDVSTPQESSVPVDSEQPRPVSSVTNAPAKKPRRKRSGTGTSPSAPDASGAGEPVPKSVWFPNAIVPAKDTAPTAGLTRSTRSEI